MSVFTTNSSGQFASTKFIVGPAGQARYSMIADALADMVSGDAMIILPGTYIESPTWVAGISVSGSAGALGGHITITGPQSFSATGTLNFSNISFSAAAGLWTIGNAGAGSSLVRFDGCNFAAAAGAALTITSAGGSGIVNVSNCVVSALGGAAAVVGPNGTLNGLDTSFTSNAANAVTVGASSTVNIIDCSTIASAGNCYLISDATGVLESDNSNFEASAVGVTFTANGTFESIADTINAAGAFVATGSAPGVGTINYSYLTASGVATAFDGNVTATPYNTLPSAGIVTLTGNGAGGATGTTVDLTTPVRTSGTGQGTASFTASAAQVSFQIQDATTANIGIGARTLENATTAAANICIGSLAGFSLTTASGNGANILIGPGAGQLLTTASENIFITPTTPGTPATGSFNTVIGTQAGGALTGSDSSNICLMSPGVTGDNNVMRLGTTGAGIRQVSTTYIAGVASVAVANKNYVTINTATGQMGSDSLPISAVSEQIFTSNGTYTPTPGMKFCIIEAVGGGGGGGGAQMSGVGTGAAGGGGGAGGYARLVATAATIGASQAIGIGAAGTAGANTGGNGGNGGDTTVGALITAGGGLGGNGSTAAAATSVQPVGGGTATGGDLNVTGNPGGSGWGAPVFWVAGYGGASYFGGAGAQIAAGTGNVGNPAVGFGSGGAGGISVNSAGEAGGAGFAGVVFITEYA